VTATKPHPPTTHDTDWPTIVETQLVKNEEMGA